MENELECLVDRKGHDGHLAKTFFILLFYTCSLNDLEKFG